MPQFAVYRNPGRVEDIPYLLQVQTSRLDRSRSRVLLALVRAGHGAPPDHALTPHLQVNGQAVFVNPLNMATITAARLGEPVAVLGEHDQDRVIRAIDEMISRG
jgi:toxin CcdB